MIELLVTVLGPIAFTVLTIVLILFLLGEIKMPMWWQKRQALKNLVRIRWHSDGEKYLENPLEDKIKGLEYRLNFLLEREKNRKKK